MAPAPPPPPGTAGPSRLPNGTAPLGGIPGSPQRRTAATQPVHLLVLAAGLVCVGLALWLTRQPWAAALGYAVSAVGATSAVVLYRRTDITRSREAGYRPRPGVHRIPPWILVAAVTVGAANAWVVATELAKQ